MKLRKYKTEDCETVTRLFYETIHTVNWGDYTKEQVDAWATGQVDLESWDRSLLAHNTLVAVVQGEDQQDAPELIVGFGDMDERGYLDRLFVHKDYQGKGVAKAICHRLEAQFLQGTELSKGCCFTTHASITARPFFEKRGYQVIEEQQVERAGQLLTNFSMKKEI